MGKDKKTSKVEKFKKRIVDSIIQDCPPELYACEICGKLECNNEKWLNCETRIRMAESIKSEDAAERSPVEEPSSEKHRCSCSLER